MRDAPAEQDWRRIADIVHEWTRPTFSEQSLAAILGISRDTLKRRLTGKQPWRRGELEVLANTFKMPVEQITGNHTDGANTS